MNPIITSLLFFHLVLHFLRHRHAFWTCHLSSKSSFPCILLTQPASLTADFLSSLQWVLSYSGMVLSFFQISLNEYLPSTSFIFSISLQPSPQGPSAITPRMSWQWAWYLPGRWPPGPDHRRHPSQGMLNMGSLSSLWSYKPESEFTCLYP